MSNDPIPMNRERRRTAKAPKPQATLHDLKLRLKLMSRKETQQPDGWVYAQSYFNVVAPNGQELCEESGEGAIPLVIATVPQPIRRDLAAPKQKLILP